MDARTFLPALRCRAGVSSWLVLDDARVPRPKEGLEGIDGGGSQAAPSSEDGAAATAAAPEPSSRSTPLEACLKMGMRLFRSPDDVPDSGNMKRRFRQSLFPPSEEEAAWMHLGQ